MKEKSVFFWLLLILIIATIFRVYQLDRTPPGLYPDEAMNGNNAVHALKTGDFKLYYPDNNGREGLFINIQAFFIKFFGGITEPWVLRFPSALIGILTVWGLYLLGKELFSKRVGLISAFFLATSFWHINFSRIGFRAIMAPLLLTWSLYILVAAIKRARDGKKLFWLSALAGGIVFGLGFHTYIAYRIAPLLLLFFIPFFRKYPNFWKVVIFFLLGAFLAGLPIGLYYLHNPADFFGRTTEISIFSSRSPLIDLGKNILVTLGMFNFHGDSNWRHNLSGRPELFWPVGILFALGIILGLIVLIYRKRNLVSIDPEAKEVENWEEMTDIKFSFTLLFAWFLLAFAPVVVSDEGLPHALRSILMIPPVFIFAGAGAVWLYNFLKRQLEGYPVVQIASGIFLLLLIYQAGQSYFVLWGKDPNTYGAFNGDYVEIGHIIDNISQVAPKYVVVETGGVPVKIEDGFDHNRIKEIPVSAQTVMFITGTYEPEGQRQKNVHYVLPGEEPQTPALKFYLR